MFSHKFLRLSSLFSFSLWLVIPTGDYSLECRSTRKQRTAKRCLTSVYFRFSQRTGLDKDAMYF
nr:MAG TPA: hypothetical protein [Caudoviricetes sp.]